MCTLGNFPDSVLVLAAPTPPFLNPLLSRVLKFFYIITMPPAVLRLHLRPWLCCRLSKQHSRSFGVVVCCSLCVAAEHSTPGKWQLWARPGSFSKEMLMLDTGGLGLCFLLPPLLLIFIWSLANHLPSVFTSCKNT